MMRLMEYTTSTYTTQQFFSTTDVTSSLIFSSDSSYTTTWETSSSKSSWRMSITADRSSVVETSSSSTQFPMSFFGLITPYTTGYSTSSRATFSVATSYTTSSDTTSEIKGTTTESSTSTASLYRLGPFHATFSDDSETVTVQYEYSFTSRTTSYTSQSFTGNITTSYYDITNADSDSVVISSTRHEWYEASKYTTTYISSQETVNNRATYTYITYSYSTSFYSKNKSFYTSSLSTTQTTLPSQVSVEASVTSYRDTQYETSTTEKSLLDFTSTYSMWDIVYSISSWTGTRTFWGYYTTEDVTYFPIKHLTEVSTGTYQTLDTVNYNTVSSSAGETTPISQVVVFPKQWFDENATTTVIATSETTFTSIHTSYFLSQVVTEYISTWRFYTDGSDTVVYSMNTSMFFESTVYDTTVVYNYTRCFSTLVLWNTQKWISSTMSVIYNPAIAASRSTVTSMSSTSSASRLLDVTSSSVNQISSTYV